ncbi:hypothetical protein T08_818 [Trichinella sp. T8]|nr:hypothetical protein T08_818 [Trichinella sp. T8]
MSSLSQLGSTIKQADKDSTEQTHSASTSEQAACIANDSEHYSDSDA